MIGDRWKDVEAGSHANGLDQVSQLRNSTDPGRSGTAGASRGDRESPQGGWSRRRGRMRNLGTLKIKIFADGADKAGMLKMYARPRPFYPRRAWLSPPVRRIHRHAAAFFPFSVHRFCSFVVTKESVTANV
jgi:hypothetical protein